jgi:hypothetical protein
MTVFCPRFVELFDGVIDVTVGDVVSAVLVVVKWKLPP